MATDGFLPDAETQAEEILREIRSNPAFNLDPEIGSEDIIDNIDPEMPVSVNLAAVLDGLAEAL